MLIDYLVSLAPWAMYIAVSHVFSWSSGFSMGLAVAAAIVVWRTFTKDSRFIDLGTLGYCALMTIISTTDPSSPLRPYNLPLSLAAIGTLSTISLVMRSPFTYRIEKAHISPKVLANPLHHGILYRAHVIATSSWSICQYIGAGGAALLVHAKLGGAAVVPEVAGTIIPTGMTVFHSGRAKLQISASAGEMAPESNQAKVEDLSQAVETGYGSDSSRGKGGAQPQHAGTGEQSQRARSPADG